MRATVEKHYGTSTPPIIATIAAGDNDVSIRISDQGLFSSLAALSIHSVECHLGGGLRSAEHNIKAPADLFSFSHIRNAARLEHSRLGALRTMSSKPEGVKATVNEQVDRWQKPAAPQDDGTDPERKAGISPHPRLGVGLPMSNIFAT
jgi:pyruvate dehydrogenase kinase 2/3/4